MILGTANNKVTITHAESGKNTTQVISVVDPATLFYTVTIDCGANGTCKKDPDKAEYSHGEEVEVSILANDDYVIDSIIDNGTAIMLCIGNKSCGLNRTIYQNRDFVFRFRSATTNLTVKAPPTKTTYTAGDKLDLSGLIVTLTKVDNTTEDVSFSDFAKKGITVAPTSSTALSTAHKEITITHTASGKTVKQPLVVKSKEIISTPTPTSTISRFWSNDKQAHFYTINQAEKEYIENNYPSNVWKYEGPAYHAYAKQATGTSPVYRFWSDKLQAHFYTISHTEKEFIEQTYPDVWTYEGIAYNALPNHESGTSPIHRFYSLTNKKHFYTISEDEKNRLIGGMYPEAQFQYEGVAWYASQYPTSHTRPLHRSYSENSAVPLLHRIGRRKKSSHRHLSTHHLGL